MVTCKMLDNACSLFGSMTQEQVKAKWPHLHKVIKCVDMDRLQSCAPNDLVPLNASALHEYEEAERMAQSVAAAHAPGDGQV